MAQNRSRLAIEEEEEEGEWTKLDISERQLIAVSPNIAIYTNITKLNLQKNNLSRLPIELFRFLTKLSQLDLSHNKFTVVQPEIRLLLNLKELNLGFNFLRELPIEVGKLFRLEKLTLDGNPIKQDYLNRGAQEIVRNFRELIQHAEPPDREWVTINKSNGNLQPKGLKVVCYNILAHCYVQPDRIPFCPEWGLKWEYRKKVILKEIKQEDPDIICLQEVESEQYEVFFLPELQKNYAGKFCPKGRARSMDENSKKNVDGCVTFWKKDLFSLVAEELIEFQSMTLARYDSIGQVGVNRMMMRDNIALSVTLKPIKGPNSIQLSNSIDNDFLHVVNTHIYWDPGFPDVKLFQVQLLLEKIEEISKKHLKSRGRPLPLILCGDFNSEPNSAVYTLLSGKYVPGHDPDFVGQDYGAYSKKGLTNPIPLKSAYGTVLGAEPPFTNYTMDFIGVLDYIWFSEETLAAEKVLGTVKEEIILATCGALPNPHMPSDHISLAAILHGRSNPNPNLGRL